ncbi:MAG: aldehyde ferredoxin oxidoreductase C-terminal domain-containing protein [Desulfurococcaceae archaeon]
MYGVNGKILEVELDNGKYKVIDVDEKIYKMFIGGRGLATYYLAKNYGEIWKHLDPFSPSNPLIISTGPLTGFYPGLKLSITGKSPQSHGVIGSTVSSEIAIELKAAGYDALIIKGACHRPSYLYVEDGKVEVREADELWGLTGLKLIEKFSEIARREHGLETPPGLLYIGPAGENVVRTATVMAKLTHAAGYGGYGSLMWAKKLKAIAVKGYGPFPKAFDPARLRDILYKTLNTIYGKMKRFRQWGTTEGLWHFGYHTSSIPIRNWQEEWHDNMELSPLQFEARTWIKNPWSEYACPVGCMKLSKIKTGDKVYITDGPDYEMGAYLGPNLGVFKPEDIVKLTSLMDELGLCGIQTGNVIGFAIELYEKGVLSKDDIGYELKWGDVKSIERLIYDIAYRRGIGNILAEGIYRACREISRLKDVDACKYAVHVKGIGIGAHGIRSGKDYPQPISYAASVQGGDHTSVAGLPVKSTESEAWAAFMDSAVVCMFLAQEDDYMLEYLNTVTGWGFTKDDLYNAGIRILTLQRILLLIGGPDLKWDPIIHDENPEKFYEPLPKGPFKGSAVDKTKMIEQKKQYYSELGWDERGIPLPETMDKLGIGEFKHLIEKIVN